MGKQGKRQPSTTLDQARKELGLPASAQFVGYGVQRPDTEEFLGLAQRAGDLESWGWTVFPNYGIHFPYFHKARREARRYGKGAVVVCMFDVGNQYVVSVVD